MIFDLRIVKTEHFDWRGWKLIHNGTTNFHGSKPGTSCVTTTSNERYRLNTAA